MCGTVGHDDPAFLEHRIVIPSPSKLIGRLATRVGIFRHSVAQPSIVSSVWATWYEGACNRKQHV